MLIPELKKIEGEDKLGEKVEKCEVCGNQGIIQATIKEKRHCNNCYRKERKEICFGCGKIRRVDRRIDEKAYCPTCSYKMREKELCAFCGEMGMIWKRTEEGPECSKCYKRNSKKEKCSCCGKLHRVEKIIDGLKYCSNCAAKKRAEECCRCGLIKRVSTRENGLAICNSCRRKENGHRKCVICGEIRRIETAEGLCLICYKKERMKNDENYRIRELIRGRIRNAVKRKFTAKYKEIITFLGPCPGNLDEYHIDHYFPLSAFDLTDKKEIQIAFSPENHQWLTAKENIAKGNKYNKKELEIFKSKIIKKYNLDENNS